MFVDFALVQLSMIIALAVCVFYHAAVGQIAQASTVIQIVRRYYSTISGRSHWFFRSCFC